MRIETAEASLRRAVAAVGLSLDAPTLEGVLAAMSAFAREPAEGIPDEEDCDRLLGEVGVERVGGSPSRAFSVRRQLIDAGDDYSEIYQFGMQLTLRETPELQALALAPDDGYRSLLELWSETADVDRWLADIRAAPVFAALIDAPIVEAVLWGDTPSASGDPEFP